MAKREEARIGGGNPREVDIQGGMDSGVEGEVWSEAIEHIHG